MSSHSGCFAFFASKDGVVEEPLKYDAGDTRGYIGGGIRLGIGVVGGVIVGVWIGIWYICIYII